MIATLTGLIVIGRSPRSQIAWGVGLAVIAIPHLIGAPAAHAAPIVPRDLAVRFAWTSVATRFPFWLLLGAIGGYCLENNAASG